MFLPNVVFFFFKHTNKQQQQQTMYQHSVLVFVLVSFFFSYSLQQFPPTGIFFLFFFFFHFLTNNAESFENGYNGWTVADLTSPLNPATISTAGQNNGFGFFSTQPTDGTYSFQHGFDAGT